MTLSLKQSILCILIAPILLVSCVADKGASKKADCATNQIFDAVSRKCVASQGATTASRQPPVATSSTATIAEDSLGSSIILNYTDIDGDLATSCSIVGYDIITFSASPTCSCSGGFCFATVIPTANHSRLTSFTYTISDPIDGASLQKTIAISMTNSNDLPTFSTTVVAGSTAEDTTLNLATLPGVSDIDCNASFNDLPNANCPSAFTYQVTSFTETAGVGSPSYSPAYTTIIKNCMGLNGSSVNDLDCDIVPQANFYGTYQFVYRGNDGWGNSTNTVTVTITVTSVNDGPLAACTSVPCTITVDEDGNATEPQDPTAAVVNYDFLLKDAINYTYKDVEDTANVTVTDSDDYATCSIDASGITLGTVTLLSAATCQIRWAPGALNTNGSAGSFTVTFVDAGGASTTPFTVNLTVTAKNDDPTAVATFAYNTFDTLAFQESPTAFAQGAGDYPYSFTIDASTTVDPSPGSATEALSYTLDTVQWNLNGVSSGGPIVPSDSSVPFAISGCMGGTATLLCTLTLNGDEGNADGTIQGNFTVSDGNGGTDTGSFIVTIQPVIDAPVACQYSRFIDSPECGLSGCKAASSPLNAVTPSSHTTAKPVFWYDSSKTTCWKSTGTGISNWTPNGKNEVQKLSFNGVPTSGDFTLDFNGDVTASIAYNATTSAIETALEALAGLTNVAVTGSIGSTLTITFTGNVALTNVTELLVSTNTLSNGSAINISPSTTTQGGNSVIADKSINEKDILYIRRLIIDEGGTSAAENALGLTVSNLTSSNAILIQPANVLFSYDGTASNEARADLAAYNWQSAAADDSSSFTGYIKITPTGTTAGSSTISFDLSNGSQITSVSFVVTVNPVSIKHNDWKVIRAAGPTVNKYGEVKSVSNVCSYSRDQCNGSACTGTSAPTVATNGGANGALYFATGTSTCYHHNGSDWFALAANVCPVTATAFESNCSGDGASCVGNAVPATGASKLGHYYYDIDDDTCYVSTATAGLGTDWTAYNAPATATITWENFTLSGTGSISGYWVYRRVAGQTFDYDFPINKIIVPLGSTTYTDNATNSWAPPAPNFVYYYEVRPVVNTIPTKPVESYAQARVIAPKDNAVFTSRRIANKLMCAKLLSVSDKTNNNRCPYVGPGDTPVDDVGLTAAEGSDCATNGACDNPGYYDIGNDLIVDRFETGCPYSLAACSTTDGNCVSDLNPIGNITAVAGTIFYSRSTGICYEGSGGTAWSAWDPSTATAAEILAASTSELPPLVFVNRSNASAYCSAAAAYPTIIGLSAAPTRALPTRKQQMSYSQWDTQSLSDSSITSLETGLSLNSSAKCNSSSASGLTGYADTETPDSSSSYSLPGTNSSGIRSVATGSTVTAGCQSFSGAQDIIGNVAEWVQDQFTVDVNERQRLEFNPTPTSGTFELDFDAVVTGPINFNATAATVQATLEGLINIGAGNVSVTGSITSSSGLNITFIGALSGTNVEELIIDSTTLDSTISVSTVNDGGIPSQLIGIDTTFSTGSAGSVLSGSNRYSVDVGILGAPNTWGSGSSLSPIGPCNDTDADDTCDGLLASWDLENKFNDAGRYFIPMGLPVHRDFDDNTGDAINSAVYPVGHPLAGTQVGTITSWAKVIGQSSGITSSQLHSDSVDFNMANLTTTNAGMVAAGGFTDGAGSGLYRFKLQDVTSTSVNVGFRCIAPVTGNYSN